MKNFDTFFHFRTTTNENCNCKTCYKGVEDDDKIIFCLAKRSIVNSNNVCDIISKFGGN